MRLRPYQEKAVVSIFDYFAAGNTGDPVVGMPTGTGKSLVIGEFIKRAMTLYPSTRIMKVTHVKELIEQNFDKLVKLWPTAPAGIYSAGLNRRDTEAPVIFGGIGSVANAPEKFGSIDLLLIDECHLVPTSSNTQYQKFIKALREVNPNLKVIGFTATAYRLGFGMITDEGGLFDDVCYDLTSREEFNRLLAEGYLAPLIPKRTNYSLDVDNVRTRAGEFIQKELQEAVDQEAVTYAALKETLEAGHDRKHCLTFTSGVEHAIHAAEIYDSLGVPAVAIHSKLKKRERSKALNDFISGKYWAATNNNILTTGFDFSAIDLISVLRPTKSPGLWVQMLGRGTRPVYADGYNLETVEGRLDAIAAGPKQNCLVLDFAGNTARLGPINDPVLPRKKGAKGGTAPVRVCEVCGVYNHASSRVCLNCGAEFPRHVKISAHAGDQELLASDTPQIETYKVVNVIYQKHSKQGKSPSLKVTYHAGLRMFKEWVCLEHSGYAGKKARDWWRVRATSNPPKTIDEAVSLADTLKVPTHIRVWINKKHPEVLGYDWQDA